LWGYFKVVIEQRFITLLCQAVILIINICNFTQQQLRADDFQIPPHRQAVTVGGNAKATFATLHHFDKTHDKRLSWRTMEDRKIRL